MITKLRSQLSNSKDVKEELNKTNTEIHQKLEEIKDLHEKLKQKDIQIKLVIWNFLV